MPVTIAHPAAVLFFKQWCPRFFNFSALVAGSMAPDLAYVFHQFQVSAAAHSFTAKFLINLPAGLILLVVYFFSKNLIASQLPSPHREYWREQMQTPDFRRNRLAPSAILILLGSILIGSVTHVAWDSFTHEHGAAVAALPFLSLDLFNGYGLHVKVYKFLQYFSGVVGLILISSFYRHELSERSSPAVYSASNKQATVKFLALLALSIVAAGVLTLVQYQTESETTISHAVFLFVVNTTVLLPVTLLISGLWSAMQSSIERI
ncbi:MAG: DUF4184 family protein [Cyanobacteria bacterium SZAS-4]|nr:DUF4184 family protein [Cyanobacteria bacterium SZAS-4]